VIQAHIFNVQAIRQKACQHFISDCKNYSRKSNHSKDADYVPLTIKAKTLKNKATMRLSAAIIV
jgi:hypothetical protein